MKIYRFVPDGARFAPVELAAGVRWWPRGLELGARAEKSWPPGPEDNRYVTARDGRPVGDFPALALNVLAVRGERALAALRGLRGVERTVAMTVDGEAAAALQLPALRALDVERSRAVGGPDGEPLFFTRRAFVEKEIVADAFWLAGAMPFSDVYVTEAFRAAAEGLGGAVWELVWDGGPVEVRGVVPPGGRTVLFGPRYELEHTLLLARAEALGYTSAEVTPILERAYLDGEIPFTYG